MSEENKPCAVVLLSGGLDSATTAAVAISEGFAVHCLSFDYGQRHGFELKCASDIACSIGALSHTILKIGLDRIVVGSALTDPLAVIPQGDCDSGVIPPTYVPARNAIFLSFASALAESMNCRDIFIGVNTMDYSGYPDCRPAFISAFERMINLGTKAGSESGKSLSIRTPLIELSKKEIILKGISLNMDFSHTRSCYDLDRKGTSCGKCTSCRIRLKGFGQAGFKDPIPYR